MVDLIEDPHTLDRNSELEHGLIETTQDIKVFGWPPRVYINGHEHAVSVINGAVVVLDEPLDVEECDWPYIVGEPEYWH